MRLTADRPHAFRPRRITAARLDPDKRWPLGPAHRTCDSCGGSELSTAHLLYTPHPRRLPAGDGFLPGPGFQDLTYYLEDR